MEIGAGKLAADHISFMLWTGLGTSCPRHIGPRIDRGGRQKKVTPMKCWLAVCVALGWLRPLPVSRRRQIGSSLLAIGVVPVVGIAAVAAERTGRRAVG
jgi:hypothetical protein